MHKQGNKWRVENTPWGAWHKPNFKDQHSTECFDTNYQSNNLGARDNENYNKDLPKNSIVSEVFLFEVSALRPLDIS